MNLENCTFSWSKTPSGADEKSDEKATSSPKASLSGINLRIKAKEWIAVVGTVGAGKSSLLSAILGNMELSEGSINM